MDAEDVRLVTEVAHEEEVERNVIWKKSFGKAGTHPRHGVLVFWTNRQHIGVGDHENVLVWKCAYLSIRPLCCERIFTKVLALSRPPASMFADIKYSLNQSLPHD